MRLLPISTYLSLLLFQSTHSMKECDSNPVHISPCKIYFNPRTLWKSATVLFFFLSHKSRKISIHALYERVRLLAKLKSNPYFLISIHALYERVRHTGTGMEFINRLISIHALYERVRPAHIQVFSALTKFQSTHSMKECDSSQNGLFITALYFNPRTLWKSATLFYVLIHII